jgi:hypothetical protein
MKTFVTLIAVVALTATCFAGDATIDVASDGTVSLTFTGDPPVGLGLVCDASAAVGDAVAANITGIANAPGIFNVNIDYAHTAETTTPGSYAIGDGHPAADPAAAGVATLPDPVAVLSVGELDAADATSPVAVGVISLDAPGDVCVSEDTLRGGVVDINGAAMTITNDGACFQVGAGPTCACRGDIADALQQLNPDGVVGFGDLNALITQLAPTFADQEPVPAGYECADIADALQQPVDGGDGKIGFGDLNYMISQLAPTFADRGCLP